MLTSFPAIVPGTSTSGGEEDEHKGFSKEGCDWSRRFSGILQCSTFFFIVKTKHRIKEGMQMEPRAICSSTGDFREADSGR